MIIKKMVWVKFDIIGFHHYPSAPNDVAYLRAQHRHKFFIKVGIEVEGDNREIEFHQLLSYVKSLYAFGKLNADHRSCEMIATDLLNRLSAHEIFGSTIKTFKDLQTMTRIRRYEITVSEDNECGATIISE
jgi:hypothetical protein